MIDTTGFALPKPGVLEGRVTLSKAQMQRKRRQWWIEKKRTCHICLCPISDYSNYVLDHIIPAKGHLKNDADSNLGPAHHYPCNLLKGSRSLEDAKKIIEEHFSLDIFPKV